jgi:hypothetical protein
VVTADQTASCVIAITVNAMRKRHFNLPDY